MSAYDPLEFRDIISRIYKYKEFKPIHEFLSDPFMFFVFAFVTPVFAFVLIIGPVIIVWLLIGAIVVIWIALNQWVAKQKSKYEVNDAEFAAYYSRFISIALTNREAAKKTVKEDYSKEAEKNAREFLKVIRERWTVGKFKLERDIFAEPLKEFRLGLQFRVIPSLKGEDEEQFKIVKDAMATLYLQCKNLQLSDIMDFNKSISILPNKQPNMTGAYKQVVDYVSNHRNLRGSIYLIGIISLCAAFAYSSFSYFQIPREYVYAGTIAIFVALLELIFHRK